MTDQKSRTAPVKYADLGVASPRAEFERLTGGEFSAEQYELLISAAAVAQYIRQYLKMGELLDRQQAIFEGLQALHDELEKYSESEDWSRIWGLYRKDRLCEKPMIEMLTSQEEDSEFTKFWLHTMRNQLAPDRPELFMKDLREHIQQVLGLMALFFKFRGRKGRPHDVGRYFLVFGCDQLAHAGLLPRVLTGKEFALVAEDVGFEELPSRDVSDEAGNIEEGRELIAKQWFEAASSARGKRPTKLSSKYSDYREAFTELLESMGVNDSRKSQAP